MQNSNQWALWALTLCAGEWITEHNKHCSEKCLRVILETEDAGRLATVTAYYRTAQEKGRYFHPSCPFVVLHGQVAMW